MALTEINRPDNQTLVLGTGSDLTLKHDGTRSYITNTTGALYLESGSTEIGLIKGTYASGEWMLRAINDGAVELYHNNSKKLHTHSTGVTVTGYLHFDDGSPTTSGIGLGNSDDIQIYHNGTNSFIYNATGNFNIRADALYLKNKDDDETYVKCVNDGSVELYHDNTKKFETTSDGFKCEDSVKGVFGLGNDLHIFHDGTDTQINNNTGILKFGSASGGIELNTVDGHAGIKIINDAAVELYHNNTKKLETTSTGAKIAHTANAHLQITGGEGYHAQIEMHADEGDNNDDKWQLDAQTGNAFVLYNYSGGSWEKSFLASGGGAFNLYYDNVKKFDTKSDGVDVYGQIAHHFDAAVVYGHIYHNSSATGTCVRFESDGTGVGSISITASNTAFNTSSDYRLKENEVAISDGITRLKTLKPYRFNFKAEPSKTVDGFFAHEVTAVPEAVTGEKDATEMQEIDQSKLVPLLTAALKEAITKIETLETKVAALEAA